MLPRIAILGSSQTVSRPQRIFAGRFSRRAYANSFYSTSTLESVSRLNVRSTFPPVLESLPARTRADNILKYYYKVGRVYLKFYKTGFKQILDNRKLAKQIRAMHPRHPMLQAYSGNAIDRMTGQIVQPTMTAVPGTTSLSRADFQLIRRHASDIAKMPAMGLLLAIFGEWLPLFVVFLDPLIPGTMLLPKQITKRRSKLAKLNKSLPEDSLRISINLEGPGIHDRPQLKMIAKRFGVVGFITQNLPSSIILRRIRRHQEYLSRDDAFLRDALSSEKFDVLELDAALEERGIWEEDQTYEEKLEKLTKWLSQTPLDS